MSVKAEGASELSTDKPATTPAAEGGSGAVDTRPAVSPTPVVVLVAGTAGSGKSTLGRALARRLEVPMLDLDTVTNPLLDAVPAETWDGHWLTSPVRESIRAGRYAALLATAGEVLATVNGCVLVAPFTRELSGGQEWRALVEAVGAAPHVVHLVGDPAVLSARRAQRGEDRDAYRQDATAPTPVRVPVVEVDVELSTSQQLTRALVGIGQRNPFPGAPADFGGVYDAVLFDLDGTLVDSTASVIRSWRRFAEELGLSMEALHENHGRTARTLVEALLPQSDVEPGLARIETIEIDDAITVTATPGALKLFADIGLPRRGVVTSGSRRIASARLREAGFTLDTAMVTADDVTVGKPDPEPFLLAAKQLGVPASRCLAVEDAVAGVVAAKAAGCQVLAVEGTVPAPELMQAGADWVVDALDRVRLEDTGGRVSLAAADGT